MECTLPVKPPKYSVILDLDRKIRDFEMPEFTRKPLPENGGLNLVMSHYMPKNYREFSTFLYSNTLVVAAELMLFCSYALRPQRILRYGA